MTVTRRSHNLKKLPKVKIDLSEVLSQKANLEAQLQEDKAFLEKVDFDPIHDVEPLYPHEKNKQYRDRVWESRDNKIGPECFGGSDYDIDPASINATYLNYDGFAEAEAAMKNLRDRSAQAIPVTKPMSVDGIVYRYTRGSEQFDSDEAWIQTYSGKRFTPMKPNPEAIVIQDIAHSLAMQCRFSGHVKQFYSVAQHCVLVSHVCDQKDALWGLLHDATEAYLVDVPRPIKRSGKFGAYIECEKIMQEAICNRFELSKEEPESVHKADTILLATEARDLMYPLRYDWIQPVKPLPFKIEPLGPKEAKTLYLERFYELIGFPEGFQRHLADEHYGVI